LTLLKARSLTYLMVSSRLRNDVDGAAELVDTVRRAARAGGLPEYEAMARATAAWASFRRGDIALVEPEATRALETWSALPNRYPVDWMACFPLLAVAVEDCSTHQAVRWAKMMLADDQQGLPSELADALRSGVEADRQSRSDITLELFRQALEVAVDLAYL
jgi:hypothetical protein